MPPGHPSVISHVVVSAERITNSLFVCAYPSSPVDWCGILQVAQHPFAQFAPIDVMNWVACLSESNPLTAHSVVLCFFPSWFDSRQNRPPKCH